MKKLLLITAASATILSSAVFADANIQSKHHHAASPCDSLSESTVAAAPAMGSTAMSSDADKWYVRIDAGAVWLDKLKLGDAVKVKSKNTGFIGQLGVGYYIMDNFRTDVTFAMLANTNFKKSFVADEFDTTDAGNVTNVGDTTNVKIKPKVMSLLVNGYYDFADVGMMKFFAGAGIGAARVKYKTDINNITAGWSETGKTKNKTTFAYQLTLGTSAVIADNVKAELAYSWRDYGKPKDGARLKGHHVTAGLRFDF